MSQPSVCLGILNMGSLFLWGLRNDGCGCVQQPLCVVDGLVGRILDVSLVVLLAERGTDDDSELQTILERSAVGGHSTLDLTRESGDLSRGHPCWGSPEARVEQCRLQHQLPVGLSHDECLWRPAPLLVPLNRALVPIEVVWEVRSSDLAIPFHECLVERILVAPLRTLLWCRACNAHR